MKIASLLVLVLSSSTLVAAAPKVDYLYPAGGQRGTTVDVLLGGSFDPWPVQVWASHPGIQATAAKKAGQCSIVIAPEVPCGTHWLRFINKDGASGLRPFLVNQLPELLDKEPNEEPKKAQEVKEAALVINGRLEKLNDTDVFALNLKKGQTLVASLQAYHLLRSPMDAVLQILSADGFVAAQNDDFKEMDPFLAFDVPKDGLYFVRLFCFPSVADSRVGLFGKETCIYRLTLTTGPFIDHAWPLAVERSKPGDVELIGWNIPADKQKVIVSPNKDSVWAFLQPEGFANGTLVRVESHPTQLVAEKSVAPPITLTDRVKDPAGAKIHLDLKKGAKLSLQMEARTLDFPLDPVLLLLDPAGKQVQRVQSATLNKDPSLDFLPTQDGKHTLLVRDLHEEGGPRHVFRLRALSAVPDFDAALATDRTTTTPGKPVEAPITLTRKNGLKDALDFSAEGLGPDVRIEFVPSKDDKQNKLVIHGVKEGNKSFRLFAQVRGRDDTRRSVLAALPELNTNVPYLWLAEIK